MKYVQQCVLMMPVVKSNQGCRGKRKKCMALSMTSITVSQNGGHMETEMYEYVSVQGYYTCNLLRNLDVGLEIAAEPRHVTE